MRTQFSSFDSFEERPLAQVTYIEHDGAEHVIDVPNGDTVMQGATRNGVDGIVAECGGALACATCHVYVDEAWTGKVGGPSEMETQMLEFAASEARPNSRLSCQITVSDELNGLVVRLPQAQF
jgi:2Fe-2S ferredoxin